jgi:phosphoserine phosphatase
MKTAAIIYDFDGTLARGNMQEHSFIPTLGIEAGEFWERSNSLAKEQDGDQILTYMREMLRRAKIVDLRITRELLQNHGREVQLFKGVEDWFDRINAYASGNDLSLEHYIISSGIREMIEGCKVAEHFKKVFASSFLYEDGEAVWPALSINYTTKTQYLFRINKGIDNCWDDEAINKWMALSERPVPFRNMIFLGDGETDIPTMKMVRHQGGAALAVFDPERWGDLQSRIHALIAEDRADFVAPADYSEGGQLEVTVKGLLGRIAIAE